MAIKAKQGVMLAGRYRLLERLGEGGMGSVWKAAHLLLDSHVAIKLIEPDVARPELNLARFLREAKTLASLRSPHVVQVLDFGSDGDTPYLVMELLEGQTLGRRLLERGRLSLAETSSILSDVCSAISLVHEQGLIHRDLKPENIFLCESGEQRLAKVVDFGIAKSLRDDMLVGIQTRTGHMLGTPSYMSPEQCRGLKDIDHRADLWALGVIAYECLIGKVPFEGQVLGDLLLRICMDPLPVPSRQTGSAVPSAFDAWFATAVARDRATRFQSAAELESALAALSTSRSGVGLEAGARQAAALRSSSPRSSPGHSSPQPRQSTPRQSTPRQSTPRHALVGASAAQPDTETNTTMGLAGPAGRAERRTQRVALGAVGVVGLLGGVWALGPRRPVEAEVPPSVEVQSLRPAYEVAPRVLHPRVPTGRRLPSALTGGGLPASEASGSPRSSAHLGSIAGAGGASPAPAESPPASRGEAVSSPPPSAAEPSLGSGAR